MATQSALCINEIVAHILRIPVGDDYLSENIVKHQGWLFKCTLVNRVFAEEATRLLWAYPYDPRVVRKGAENQPSQDLDRLSMVHPKRRQYYAAKIRKLSITLHASRTNFPDLQFPSLRHLRFRLTRPFSPLHPAFDTFEGAKVESVVVYGDVYHGQRSNEWEHRAICSMGAQLRQLNTTYPSVKHLSMAALRYPVPCRTVTRILCDNQNLQSIELPRVGDSRYSSWHGFVRQDHDTGDVDGPSIPDSTWNHPSLRRLKADRLFHSEIKTLLCNLQNLESCELFVDTSERLHEVRTDGLVDLGHLSRLRELRLNFFTLWQSSEPQITARKLLKLAEQVPDMRRLYLHLGDSTRYEMWDPITDRTLEKLLELLPQLEYFELTLSDAKAAATIMSTSKDARLGPLKEYQLRWHARSGMNRKYGLILEREPGG